MAGRRRRAARARIVAAVAPLALVALLVGCDSTAPSGTAPAASDAATVRPEASAAAPTLDIGNSSYRPAAGRDGGRVVIGAVDAANIFQPYFVHDPSDVAVAAAAWSPLVTLGPDGRYFPVLAASVPTPADGSVAAPGTNGDAMTVRWRLRDGLAWSDGKPLTCDDVRWTWQWARDPDNIGIDATGLEDLADVECPSATDMVWHFSKVYGPFLDLLRIPLPRHALEAIPMADLATGKGFTFGEVAKLPVSGPFRFTSAVPGANLEMSRNEQYQRPAGGRAHLDKLTWRWYATPASLVSALKAREVDVAIGLSPTDVDVRPFGDRALSVDSLTAETLLLNWAGGNGPGATSGPAAGRRCSRSVLVVGRGPGCPVADPAIRDAIATAVDRASLVAGPLGGRATAIASDVPDVLWYASGRGAPTGDPTKARAILDRAGWVPGPDGTRTRDGLTARIEICVLDAPWRVAMARLVAGQLAAIGIAAEVSPASSEDLAADADGTPGPCSLPESNFDVALVPVDSPTDPLGTYFAWHSSQIPPNGTNVGAVADPDLDAALESIRETADPGAMATAMRAVDRAASTSVPDVPLVRRASIVLVGATARNVIPSSVQPVATWNVGDWFVTK